MRHAVQFYRVTSVHEHGLESVKEQTIFWFEQEFMPQYVKKRLTWMALLVFQSPKMMFTTSNSFGQAPLRDSLMLPDATQVIGKYVPRDDLTHSFTLLVACQRHYASGQ